MGLRYRKSINLGGGFRINLSKSGIGYSWGVKGYRVTKTAKGTTRKTASIPGTGISYVQETGRKNRQSNQKNFSPSPQATPVDNNHYDTQNIINNVATEMVSEGLEDMLSSASRSIKLDKLSNFGMVFSAVLGCGFPLLFLLTALFVGLKIYVRTKGTIDLDYHIDEDQQAVVDEHLSPMIRITKCNKTWRIMQTSKVIDKKYASGANNTVKRTQCKSAIRSPFPFKTNIQIASFKTAKETLLFLPDKLFILQGSKIGALNYNDITSSAHTTRFIESEGVPNDAQIVGQTWKYVNKSGGPDRRFKDNRQLPICLYGELELASTSGLNTVIMFSNPSMQES